MSKLSEGCGTAGVEVIGRGVISQAFCRRTNQSIGMMMQDMTSDRPALRNTRCREVNRGVGEFLNQEQWIGKCPCEQP